MSETGACYKEPPSYRLLIKNGKVVNDDAVFDADIYIENGIIKEIGAKLTVPKGTRTIDAEDNFLLPGGIDPHTNFDGEFMGTKTVDDFYTGTKAAIAGGTTTIIDCVFPEKGKSILDCFHEYRQKADGQVCCDYALHVCLTEWSDDVKREMEVLSTEHGVNSFMAYMAYNFMLNDAELYSVFEHCKKLGAIAMVHAENGLVIEKIAEKLITKGFTGPKSHNKSRPEDLEGEAVNRACIIAKQLDCPLYVCQVMSQTAARVVESFQKSKCRVFAETLPAIYAIDNFSKNPCFDHAAGYITSPPIRFDSVTSSLLMNGIVRGVIDVAASNNRTYTKAQKEMGKGDFRNIPHGVNGVEDRMSVFWEKGIHTFILDPRKFVALTSTNAAKIFNLYPKKGTIAVGSDADIVIWNAGPSKTISAKTHHLANDFNIFEGMKCHGVIEYVIVKGQVCVDKRQLKEVKGLGSYLETSVHPPFVYDPDKIKDWKPDLYNTNTYEPVKEEDVQNENHPLRTESVPDNYLADIAEDHRNILRALIPPTNNMYIGRHQLVRHIRNRMRNSPGKKPDQKPSG